MGYYGYSEMVLRCHLGLSIPPNVRESFNQIEDNTDYNIERTNWRILSLHYHYHLVLAGSGSSQGNVGRRQMFGIWWYVCPCGNQRCRSTKVRKSISFCWEDSSLVEDRYRIYCTYLVYPFPLLSSSAEQIRDQLYRSYFQSLIIDFLFLPYAF